MSQQDQPQDDALLNAFLDGALNPVDRAKFEARLEHDPAIKADFELQSSIDDSLRRQFHAEKPSDEQVQALLERTRTTESMSATVGQRRWSSNGRRVVLVAIAALVAWIIVAWQLRDSKTNEPAFTPRSLVRIYEETIAKGFEPYYECRDDVRFAATFLDRQGQALKLAEMPANTYMLGLSYPGGLSRKTTAILCRVDEKPVMVFVDRLSVDRQSLSDERAADVRVIRRVQNRLVFYEITPFDRDHVIEYLQPTATDEM